MNQSKWAALLLTSLLMTSSYAKTYVVNTMGGAALQPIVQNQLDQLPSGGNVMVYQDRLIINTTPQNYAKVSQFIQQLDRLPQTLTVSVRVGENSSTSQNTGYGNIGVINRQVYINGRWQNSQSQTTGNQLYQVQTLSAKPASIGLTQILSTPTVIVNGSRRGYSNNYPQVMIGNTLLSANQGISVIPTALLNGQIQVQIEETNDTFGQMYGQTAVRGQNLSTTITVNPNQWTTIGYVTNQSYTNGAYGSSHQTWQTPIQIMVH